MNNELLIQELIRDESLELKPYYCSSNKLTIGVGRNLTDKKLSPREMNCLITVNEERAARFVNVNKNKESELYNKLIADFKEFGITEEEAMVLLNNDIFECINKLKKNLPWFEEKSDNVQRVLVNMCFNLGITGLLRFVNTIRLIKEDKYEEASKQMLKSLWAKQVGQRAIRLSNLLKDEN